MPSNGKIKVNRLYIFLIPAVFVFSCTTLQIQARSMLTSNTMQATLPDLGPAPELGNPVWLNSDAPLHLAELRGKVVALEMWTFGCINCQHVIPSLKAWHAKYKDQGLVVIGNHFPEFGYEADLDNLKQAVEKYQIEYAVAVDNDGATWQAYDNHYWPTLYLIDKRGRIRFVHIGEGAYDKTEATIQALLNEPEENQE